MKIRTGFVSNSSSSSFIVLLKNPPLTKEQIFKHNIKMLEDQDKEYAESILETANGRMILSLNSIENGGEEDAQNIVTEVLVSLGYKKSNLKFIIEY
jgi:hypothetical protein